MLRGDSASLPRCTCCSRRAWPRRSRRGPASPTRVPMLGGTDLMVELNFDRRRPRAILDLTARRRAGELGADDGEPAHRRGRHLHPADRRARRPRCPASPSPRAPSARRRSATAARSAATSAPPRRPATRSRRWWPSGAVVELGLDARQPARAGRRVLHRRRSATCWRPTSSSPPSACRPPRGPPAVRQDRHAQRDGDRGLLVRARARPGRATVRHRHRLGRRRRRCRATEAEAFLAGVLDEDGCGSGAAPLPSRRAGALRRARRRPRPPDRRRRAARAAYRRHALAVLGAAHARVGLGRATGRRA